jgi:ribosomal protein L11 methyltransferase
VLARQADEVIATYSQWLKISIWKENDGWVCLHGTLPKDKEQSKKTYFAAPAQKKGVKLTLLACFFVLLLVLSEHLSRNSLLPALAPRVDGTSNSFSVAAFSILQAIDEKICGALGCLNRPVSDFAAWKITSATLSPENAREGLKSGANQSILQVEIQNRLALAVLPPNLEITLTDAEESEIKSIRLTPKEWLPLTWQESHADFLRSGIAPGEVIQTQLLIPLPQNAAGYRVRVVYP